MHVVVFILCLACLVTTSGHITPSMISGRSVYKLPTQITIESLKEIYRQCKLSKDDTFRRQANAAAEEYLQLSLDDINAKEAMTLINIFNINGNI